MGTRSTKLDLGAVEKRLSGLMRPVFFYIKFTWGCNGTRIHWRKNTNCSKDCDDVGNVLLGKSCFRCSPDLLNMLIWFSICGCAGPTNTIHGASTSQLKDIKYLLVMSWTPSVVLQSLWLGKSVLFWQHKEDQQHIRQVVIMFWLIGVVFYEIKFVPNYCQYT